MSDFTVEHNPDQLIARKTIWVNRGAEEKLARFMAEKRPRGLRIRHAENKQTGEMVLQARNHHALNTVLRFFRDAGLLRRK